MVKNRFWQFARAWDGIRSGPFGFDFGRIACLLSSPNFGFRGKDIFETTQFGSKGIEFFPNSISSSVCDPIVREYDSFINLCKKKGVRYQDEHKRHHRLTNFHLISSELRSQVVNSDAFEFSSKIFGKSASIYTSLYFKHGSQQDAHINSLLFNTTN